MRFLNVWPKREAANWLPYLCCSWSCLQSTLHGPELSDVSALQRPVLLLELSTPQGPELHLTCLHYKGLCCTWSCLHHRGLSWIWRVYTTEACAAPGVVYTTGAWPASQTHTAGKGEGGAWIREKVRGATVHKVGSKIPTRLAVSPVYKLWKTPAAKSLYR